MLVTNSHFVENAIRDNGFKLVFIKTPQKAEDVGFVLLEDTENDLAVIKAIKKIHKPLKLGKYNKAKLGDSVFVFGSPEGMIGALSKGIISAKRKDKDFNLLQITAPMSKGSSGSPVLSEDLKVIAAARSVLNEGQNINFAVPISYLKKLIKDNERDLIKISKLDLEEILNTHKAPAVFKNKNFKQTNFEKGLGYYNKKNYKQAVYWYTKSARQGFPGAQFNLGLMYYKSEGVPQNYKQAVDWFTKSARQGIPQAQNNLGFMYYKGEGVPQNKKQAVDWFTKSAKQGDPKAQNNLGLMYYKGEGVPKNYIHSYSWISLAASNNYQQARGLIVLLEQVMTPKQIASAQELSIKISNTIKNLANQ